MEVMPKWAEVVLVPLISLLLAAILSAIVILAIGENPWEALKLMVQGALGSTYGWGYTLYYATNFIFTGLAVAIAFHARMFNIGGEGQAALVSGPDRRHGLGSALWCALGRDPGLPASQARQPYRDYHDHVQLHRFCLA